MTLYFCYVHQEIISQKLICGGKLLQDGSKISQLFSVVDGLTEHSLVIHLVVYEPSISAPSPTVSVSTSSTGAVDAPRRDHVTSLAERNDHVTSLAERNDHVTSLAGGSADQGQAGGEREEPTVAQPMEVRWSYKRVR